MRRNKAEETRRMQWKLCDQAVRRYIGTGKCLQSTVEVCMGVGIPMGMGFPWESHGNGNSRVDHDGNGMGMGVKAVGMGIAYISCL